MSDGTLSSNISGGIATVEFGHPRSNSLPGSLLSALAVEITRLGANPDVRVIILRSAGSGTFCAGASFDELISIRNEDEGLEFFSGFARVILAMVRAPQLVLVRVQGKAAGGGVGLVAAADYAIATENASARLSELAVGIGPFVVGPAIERKIGSAAFGAMSIDTRWRQADWCERQGLYSRVVADESTLDEETARLAGTLADSNPEAVRALKEILRRGTEEWDSLLFERASASGRLVLSEYTRRAIEQFKSGSRLTR